MEQKTKKTNRQHAARPSEVGKNVDVAAFRPEMYVALSKLAGEGVVDG
jgi:hypothetical protein